MEKNSLETQLRKTFQPVNNKHPYTENLLFEGEECGISFEVDYSLKDNSTIVTFDFEGRDRRIFEELLVEEKRDLISLGVGYLSTVAGVGLASGLFLGSFGGVLVATGFGVLAYNQGYFGEKFKKQLSGEIQIKYDQLSVQKWSSPLDSEESKSFLQTCYGIEFD